MALIDILVPTFGKIQLCILNAARLFQFNSAGDSISVIHVCLNKEISMCSVVTLSLQNGEKAIKSLQQTRTRSKFYINRTLRYAATKINNVLDLTLPVK